MTGLMGAKDTKGKNSWKTTLRSQGTKQLKTGIATALKGVNLLFLHIAEQGLRNLYNYFVTGEDV
jgi:hypothetical protein